MIVPCNRPDGSISSLQFIALPEVAHGLKAKGKPGKLNLPGASMEGWFTVGGIEPGGVVRICEGVATAWACWQATGQAAVCTLGAGCIEKVAAELRWDDASARLVLVADRGKEQLVQDIAVDVAGQFVLMHEREANNFDASDLARRDGLDMLEPLLQAARTPTPPPLPLRVAFADELPDTFSPPDELVDGLITADDGSVLNGSSALAGRAALTCWDK